MWNDRIAPCLVVLVFSGMLGAQTPEDATPPQAKTAAPEPATPAAHGFKRVEEQPAPAGNFTVPPGTRILLNMINSVSTKRAAPGDQVYLETAFPIRSGDRIVIPQGSWVQGTITQVKRPGRVKGRGELYVRFDSLTLPNGINRNFLARMGSMDSRSTEEVNREEGKIKSSGNKGGDAQTVATTTAAGASLGTIAGIGTGRYGMGAGIGAAAGAGAGLLGVLLSRGPDATLTKGTTMEMVLDRPLEFSDKDLDFSRVVPRAALSEGSGPDQNNSKPRSRSWSPWPL